MNECNKSRQKQQKAIFAIDLWRENAVDHMKSKNEVKTLQVRSAWTLRAFFLNWSDARGRLFKSLVPTEPITHLSKLDIMEDG